MQIKEELKSRIQKIDEYLKLYLSHEHTLQNIIYDAMEYSVFAGGKRLRPILMLEVNRMCSGEEREVMPFACAMEMIHTYSLIHDDLPAMDNDTLRRGRPTSHIKFGEANAILAGDALLNKAFETMLNYGGSTKNAHDVMQIIAKSSGTEGMIGGQIIDIESENKDIDIETLKHLHSLKTGAIIRSSCIAGAMLAGASEAELDAVDKFAANLGIAFQIQDDVLDVTGSARELGKPIGSDATQHKNTYVTILGIEKAKEEAVKYSEKAKEALAIFGERAQFLIGLTDYLTNRTN